MNELTITQRHHQDVTILDLSGKIKIGEDIINLRKALRILVTEDKKNILLNLANVTHVDSSGLGELVAGYVSLEKIGGELKLLNLTDRVQGLMTITKLLTVFDTFENEEEALNSFQTISENIKTSRSAVETKKLENASASS